MSDSNRGERSPALVAEQGHSRTGSQERTARDQQTGDSERSVLPLVEQPARRQEAAIANQQAQTEQPAPHELRDLVAQEVMADAAVWMAIAAFLTLVVTVFGTILISRQVTLTREAVEDTGKATNAMLEANRLMRADQRAWIEVSLQVTKVTLQEGEIVTHCDVRLKNIGRGVARRVCFECYALGHAGVTSSDILRLFQTDVGGTVILEEPDLLPNGELNFVAYGYTTPDDSELYEGDDDRKIFSVQVVAKATYRASEDAPDARTCHLFSVASVKRYGFIYQPGAIYEEREIRTIPGALSRAT